MAKFFVGQRVRKVKNHPLAKGQMQIGECGVITAIGQRRISYVTLDGQKAVGDSECVVRWGKRSASAHALFWQLEPILPEGHKPIEIAKLLTEFPELGQVLGVSA